MAADAPTRGGTLRPGGGANAPHLDISKENTASTGTLSGTMYSRLVRWDPTKFPDERVLGPDLAQSWEVKDGTTYTFNLEDTTWHDGKAFTSADVAATMERAVDVHPFRDLFKVIEGVDTPDDRTAVFRLSRPSNIMLDAMAATVSSMVPKHIITDNADFLEDNPVGTGPFRLDSWEKGVAATVVRNDNYYLKGQPYLDAVKFLTLADSSAEVKRPAHRRDPRVQLDVQREQGHAGAHPGRRAGRRRLPADQHLALRAVDEPEGEAVRRRPRAKSSAELGSTRRSSSSSSSPGVAVRKGSSRAPSGSPTSGAPSSSRTTTGSTIPRSPRRTS